MHLTFWQCLPTYMWKKAGLYEAMEVSYAGSFEAKTGS
jgi:hypothetical protein